jgi:DUF2939 family protein
MRKPYWLAGVVLLLLAFGFAWHVFSPAWTVYRMVSAAKSGDAGTLAAHVDFPALRADLRADLSARLAAASQADGGATGRMGTAIAGSMVGAVIENFVSPGGLRMTFAALDEHAPPDANAGKAPGKPRIERLSFDRFRLSREDGAGLSFLFERHGLGWKLSGVDLPPAPPPRRAPPG